MPETNARKTILLLGASRGLGFAMAETFLEKGYQVIATARENSVQRLKPLVVAAQGALETAVVDITVVADLMRLREQLAGRCIDLLFVNAGVANSETETIADVTTQEFTRVMVTNALSPMRAIDVLQDLVPRGGTIGVMSSGQGSLSNATNAYHEVYRGSKAALNMYMRTYAARSADAGRTLLLMAPGWVKTEMGGPEARLTIAESIPNLVNTIQTCAGQPGLQYLDYLGRTVPW